MERLIIVRNRFLPLILSCLYCGLGQIYKREILKGIDLSLIYTILIVCILSSERVLFYIGAFSLPLLWIIGVIDAYGNESYQPPNIKARFLFVALAEFTIVPILLLAHGYFPSNTETPVTPKEKSSRIQDEATKQKGREQAKPGERASPFTFSPALSARFIKDVTKEVKAGEQAKPLSPPPLPNILVDVKTEKQQPPTGRHAGTAPTSDSTGTEVPAYQKQGELLSPKPLTDKVKGHESLTREKDAGRRAGEASLPADVFGQATEKRIYSVLVGSFTDEAQANRLRDKLQGKGYNAWVKPTFLRSKGQLWYGVRVGKFSSKKDAQAMALKLHRKERLEYKVKKEVSGE